MRQPKLARLNAKQQGGYVLIVVLAILVLISLMVTATYIETDSSIKGTANIADHRYARAIAEEVSQIASQQIAQEFEDPSSGILPPLTNLPQREGIYLQVQEGGPPLKTVDGQDWPQYFTADCAGLGKHPGFCAVFSDPTDVNTGQGSNASALPPVYERPHVFNQYSGTKCENAVTIPKSRLANNAARPPCYVVEFLGLAPDTNLLTYRITVMAWGKSLKTKVTLQSIYSMEYN